MSKKLSKLYRLTNSNIKYDPLIGPNVNSAIDITFEDSGKALSFAQHFESHYDTYASDLTNITDITASVTVCDIDFICIPSHIIHSYLKRISHKNKTSPDHIPNIFFKQVALSLVLPFAIIFDKCLLKGSCPKYSVVLLLSRCSEGKGNALISGSIAL